MYTMLSLILLVVAQTTTPPAAAPAEEILVVGHRATDALNACLARRCPPAEDVEASLQASVEQFSAGRYAGARNTLQKSIDRNRRHAAQLPGPVSSLYATLATVAEHEGYSNLWRNAARANVQLLRRYAGPGDRGTLLEEISLADTMIGTADFSTAAEALAKVERRALDGGHSDIAAGAVVRRAWLAFAQQNDRRAAELADHALAIAGDASAEVAVVRDVLNSRIALRNGDTGAIDALAARVRNTDTQRPTLLFSKPVEDIKADTGMMDLLYTRWTDNDSSLRFVDIGYWIRPNGRTAGAEILQTSGLGQWERAVMRQVATRRYASLLVPAGSPGVYRIDRFTIRATMGMTTGSRIQQRIGRLTTHIVDLTETEAMSAAQKRRVAEAGATTTS